MPQSRQEKANDLLDAMRLMTCTPTANENPCDVCLFPDCQKDERWCEKLRKYKQQPQADKEGEQ